MNKNTIWAFKYRPTDLSTYICSAEFKTKFAKHIKDNDIPNMILYGKPGGGKSTLANILINNIDCDHLYINASDERGIDVVREKILSFASYSSFKAIKIIVLDEADQLTSAAQLSLRNIIEQFALKTRFIFTCNYIEKINEALQSRCEVHKIEPPEKIDIAHYIINILDQEDITFQSKTLATIIEKYYPDIRKIINVIQGSSSTGELSENKLVNSTSLEEILIESLRKPEKKSFQKIRQLLLDNDINDYTYLYKVLYNNIDELFPGQESEVTILINEYLYKSISIPDREICFMSLISSILKLK